TRLNNDKHGRSHSDLHSEFAHFLCFLFATILLSTPVRVRRIELQLQPWEGRALPLRHTRGKVHPMPSVCHAVQAWALIFSTSTFFAAVPTTCSRTVPPL